MIQNRRFNRPSQTRNRIQKFGKGTTYS